jgi:AbrB family looped-hinge helix DNA binding protein
MNVSDLSTDAETFAGGFSTVDEKGRVTVSKAVREALGIAPGSSVAYLALDGALLIIPQDEHLASLMERARLALVAGGVTAQSLQEGAAVARAEIAAETYGAEFMRELEQMRSQLSNE